MTLGKPHGGKLVINIAAKPIDTKGMKNIKVGIDTQLEIENLAIGSFSPLTGFMTKKDVESVAKNMRLPDGTIWTIPIIFPLKNQNVKRGEEVLLMDVDDKPLAVMKIEDVFTYDTKELARDIFKTDSLEHPGVKKLIENGNEFVGGKIIVLQEPPKRYGEHSLTPTETRELFKKRGWKTIVGFQTRNVPHRGHEYHQKNALSKVDGIFLHPLVGWKKQGDFNPEMVLLGYKILTEKYYPKDSAVLGMLTTSMRYAGPREAVFHAIIRKNYGCTHFIVGGDHAGVKNFYGTYEAQQIFEKLPGLGIEIFKVGRAVYCPTCKKIVAENECIHDKEEISGTKIRSYLVKGEQVPEKWMRPEISAILDKDSVI